MNVDVPTALKYLDWSWYRFSRSVETIAPEQAAQLLKALEKRDSSGALFVRAAVDPDDIAGTWKPTMAALRSFQAQYSWGSAQRKKMVADAARSPRVLAAAQAAATQDDVPLELLAVLAFDGSEASADALMPHFHRAVKKADALERFSRLRVYLKDTAWTRALVAALDAKTAEYAAGSPLNRLAQRLGIATGARFRGDLQFSGRAKKKGGPRACVTLRLDSIEEAPTFWINANADRVASKTLAMDVALDAVPKTLAELAAKLKVEWDWADVHATYLRGKRLTRLLDWLKAGV